MNQFRFNTEVTPALLDQIEPELTSIIRARLLDFQQRFSYPRIARILFESLRLLGLLGLGLMAWQLIATRGSLRSLGLITGYMAFFSLVLAFAWNPKKMAHMRLPQYWSWLAKRRARAMLKRARRLAPYTSEYEFRGDLATCYRSAADKSTLAWMRRLKGYRLGGRGFTLFYKKQNSLHPYAIILHESVANLDAYLDKVGVQAIAFSLASEAASALNPAAIEGRVYTNIDARPALYAAFILTLMYAALSWGPGAYFKPKPDARTIEIFTTSWCGYCARLREFLKANKIPFRETDVEHSMRGELAQIGLATNGRYVRGIPFSTIGQHIVYGLNKGEIEKAVAELGYAVAVPFEQNGANSPSTRLPNR